MNRYTAREVIAKSPNLSRGARMLYTILDTYTRDKGNWRLKHVTLMDQLKCSKRSLQYWLAELSKAGFIRVERSATGGVNCYHMAWFGASQTETVRNEAQLAAPGGVQNAARGGAKGCVSLNKVFNTHIEHSPPNPPQAGGALSLNERTTPTPASEGFDVDEHNRRAEELNQANEARLMTACTLCSGSGRIRPPVGNWYDCPRCSATVSIGAKAS